MFVFPQKLKEIVEAEAKAKLDKQKDKEARQQCTLRLPEIKQIMKAGYKAGTTKTDVEKCFAERCLLWTVFPSEQDPDLMEGIFTLAINFFPHIEYVEVQASPGAYRHDFKDGPYKGHSIVFHKLEDIVDAFYLKIENMDPFWIRDRASIPTIRELRKHYVQEQLNALEIIAIKRSEACVERKKEIDEAERRRKEMKETEGKSKEESEVVAVEQGSEARESPLSPYSRLRINP